MLAALPEWMAPWRGPLADRIERQRGSFAALVTAPLEDAPALRRRARNERTAYGMLMHNSDGARLFDRYIYEESVMTTNFFGFLFPPKGWLPAPVLAQLLAAIPE